MNDTSNPASDATYRVTADELRQFVERIERLEGEKKDAAAAQKEVFAEAKGRGYPDPAPRDPRLHAFRRSPRASYPARRALARARGRRARALCGRSEGRGTYSDAMAAVHALLSQRDALAATVERYGQALAEIARKHRGPTFEAASKYRQAVALRALGRERRAAGAHAGAGAHRGFDQTERDGRQREGSANDDRELGERRNHIRHGDRDGVVPKVYAITQGAEAAHGRDAKRRSDAPYTSNDRDDHHG